MPGAAIPDLQDIAARMAWALLLGCVVGFERQWHQKMAGLKTNALVALGASGFVCFATVAGSGNPSVVSAQIVTGIGFLGAGVIMREGINVHGLNTAATVWCSAMVGALCGFGMWQAGGVAASLLLGANIVLRPVANWVNLRVQSGGEVERYYCLTVTCDATGAATVRAALLKSMAGAHLAPRQIVSSDGSDGMTTITVQADTLRVMDDAVERIVGELGVLAAVKGTSWEAARAVPEA